MTSVVIDVIGWVGGLWATILALRAKGWRVWYWGAWVLVIAVLLAWSMVKE